MPKGTQVRDLAVSGVIGEAGAYVACAVRIVSRATSRRIVGISRQVTGTPINRVSTGSAEIPESVALVTAWLQVSACTTSSPVGARSTWVGPPPMRTSRPSAASQAGRVPGAGGR